MCRIISFNSKLVANQVSHHLSTNQMFSIKTSLPRKKRELGPSLSVPNQLRLWKFQLLIQLNQLFQSLSLNWIKKHFLLVHLALKNSPKFRLWNSRTNRWWRTYHLMKVACRQSNLNWKPTKFITSRKVMTRS